MAWVQLPTISVLSIQITNKIKIYIKLKLIKLNKKTFNSLQTNQKILIDKIVKKEKTVLMNSNKMRKLKIIKFNKIN